MTIKPRNFAVEDNGTTAVEFAMTAPLFFLIVLGAVQVGFWLFQGFGLQHAVEMAARCASINTTLCGTPHAVQTYAAGQASELGVSASVFSVSQPSCGNQVSASLELPTFAPGLGMPSVTWHAQSCFPN